MPPWRQLRQAVELHFGFQIQERAYSTRPTVSSPAPNLPGHGTNCHAGQESGRPKHPRGTIVSQVVPGLHVNSPLTALIAALVIGLVNATIGLLLKVLTFPLTILTLGLFWFVINALMLELASVLVRGFEVRNFLAAFIGAIVLSVVSSVLHWLVMPGRRAN